MIQCLARESLSLRVQSVNEALVPQPSSLVDQRKTSLGSPQYFVYPRYFTRLFISLSALLSSFDIHVIRFQSFLKIVVVFGNFIFEVQLFCILYPFQISALNYFGWTLRFTLFCFKGRCSSIILLNISYQVSTTSLRACLHGGGGPQVGEVTRVCGVTRLSI